MNRSARFVTYLLVGLLTLPVYAGGISFTVEFDISSLLRRKRPCSPTVGYHFIGQPGQTFRYAGEWYVIDRTGYVDLIAHPRHVRSGELDQYGFRRVELPLPKVKTRNVIVSPVLGVPN